VTLVDEFPKDDGADADPRDSVLFQLINESEHVGHVSSIVNVESHSAEKWREDLVKALHERDWHVEAAGSLLGVRHVIPSPGNPVHD